MRWGRYPRVAGWRASTTVPLLLLAALVSSAPFLAVADAAAPKAACADFADLADALVSEASVPGAVFLIMADDMRCTVPVGIADRASGTPVTATTRFYVASSAKPMVAAAALDAVEQGRLELDAPIARHLEGLSEIRRLGSRAAMVTLRQLLSHRSGLPEYLSDAFARAHPPGGRWTANAAIAFADPRDARRPGRGFSYTNTNYVLLGHILTRLDGSLATSLRRRVFAPAGMRASSVGAVGGPLARGYVGNRDVSAAAWASVLGDGAVVTTVDDLARFLRVLLRGDAILSPETRREMARDHAQGYGLGLATGSDRLGRWYGHSGGYDGFSADVRHYPRDDLTVAYVANGDVSSDDPLAEIVSWYLMD